ncbi:MAG: alkaline phosphatase D family protein [Rhodothalassiaceae bacterium]
MRSWKILALLSFAAASAHAEPLTIAIGSCNNQEDEQQYWNEIAAKDPAMFLFLGDNVYGDIYREERPGVEGLRHAYELQSQHEPYRSFAQDVPIYPIWDDHDYGLNDAGEELPFKQEAKQELLAFFDFPQADAVESRDGVYYAIEREVDGMTVQILMLDTRWNRSPLTRIERRIDARRGAYVDDPSADVTILGEQQWAWLEQQLEKPADLRFIASSIQILADSHHFERWGNFPKERQKLFDLFARTGAKGIILLSGDRHLGGFYLNDQALDYPLYEFTASSLNRGGWAKTNEDGPYQILGTYGGENFGLIEIDAELGTVAMSLHRSEDGKPVRALRLPVDLLR